MISQHKGRQSKHHGFRKHVASIIGHLKTFIQKRICLNSYDVALQLDNEFNEVLNKKYCSEWCPLNAPFIYFTASTNGMNAVSMQSPYALLQTLT